MTTFFAAHRPFSKIGILAAALSLHCAQLTPANDAPAPTTHRAATCDQSLDQLDGSVLHAIGQTGFPTDLCVLDEDPCAGQPCPTFQQALEDAHYFECGRAIPGSYLRPLKAARCINEAKGFDHDVLMHYDCAFQSHWYQVFDRSGQLVQRVEQRRQGSSQGQRDMICCGDERITANLSWGRFSLECDKLIPYSPLDFIDPPAESCPWW